eukprot:Plantae.Rhodophyta-Purpureofilum_apyrenoidigerum.ctg7025.p1 GENE.Plantae.Rhodophyta-Purpureofilum_apyrenoidigerum.ctg7025~~Plantae.Rhodophyta-Purpureofilum_apyrenoidigerum.ctg7025.p1  ORF type:complete len:485 (-),score=52.41 Plantae.Rhodophyta-Purpureofilum_apyrenoidigerum.ctg7025:920-2374(-)
MATAAMEADNPLSHPHLKDRGEERVPKLRYREDLLLEFAVETSWGRRGYMEDRHAHLVSRLGFSGPQIGIFCVYDGHGGELAANFCEQRFVKDLTSHNCFDTDVIRACSETVQSLDEAILDESKRARTYAGSTLNSVIIQGKNIYCCNVGDSRSVLCRNGVAHPLSIDHSPLRPAEVKRIREAGGFVSSKGVNGVINLTRALGDLDLKEHKELTFPGQTFTSDLIISEPEFSKSQLTVEDEFVIVASDGLWGKVTSSAAVKLARRVLETSRDAHRCAKALVKAAYDAGSLDNITVMVVLLREPSGLTKETQSTHILRRMKSLAPAREVRPLTHNSGHDANRISLFESENAQTVQPVRGKSTLGLQMREPSLQENESLKASFFRKFAIKVSSNSTHNDSHNVDTIYISESENVQTVQSVRRKSTLGVHMNGSSVEETEPVKEGLFRKFSNKSSSNSSHNSHETGRLKRLLSIRRRHSQSLHGNDR